MVKNPPPWFIQFFVMFLLFIGSCGLGLVLAHAFAPDSVLLTILSFFMLPLSFIFGMQCWLGFALFHAVLMLLKRFIGKKPLRAPHLKSDYRIPAGSFVFFPLSFTAGTIVGIVAFFVASGLRWQAFIAYVLAGAVHGFASWRSARGGFLPFPQPM